MPKLWLTYAWKDNETEDVDHIVAELRKAGLDVTFDRVRLLAGRRLWEQISAGISDQTVNGWAIFATENSLKSEPCQEELAYALDRTLRTRGATFPLIGLFAGEFDRALIPSALATRLCVNLHSNEWKQQIIDALVGKPTSKQLTPEPFGYKLHNRENGFVLEVWPRTGTWTPVIALVDESEKECLNILMPGPRGIISGTASLICSKFVSNGSYGIVMQNPVNSSTTAHIFLSKLPRKIMFGPQSGTTFTLDFNLPTNFNAKMPISFKGELITRK
ncbi:toll/interleukin-1 receptor domain-containing protein [Asticcacaulis sp. ZE23SCel15]|uniref:toll/interleukin-1 receptor domain-containing protein n=1 Tax=Asticcacaulis sp. ZE23SCel15 TaxID=3059027 RepID=UPI00265F417D|nr:toll/interleukin-1 receptor domain-containing protein [Asticcacaulis sp. ZE23SCel15]WKL57689.1 toll/interleukin-1 receptor domain-containing protein [Asticcacaulis sp. ZE23SCel15]